ncbi:MAG: glycosyltransferase family 2 protein [Armatimonadetes bacterium]|nr:glycosyltransferase family 2 protein [Armatimonadota bacterium]
MPRMIQFSVIIPTFNRGALLREVVYALTHQESPGCDYEIVPVDNASTDNTRAVVEEMSTASPIPIRYQYEPKPGSHYARNTGFKSANGEILGLIDDDVVVDSSWVRQMTQPYEDPKVSCVGGRIILRWINGEPQEFLASYREILGEINYGPQFKELTFPVSVNAGNLSIRREMLMGVGGYNPCSAPGDLRLVGDGEVGLCNKVYASGGRIFWNPAAIGWHVQDASRIGFRYLRNRMRINGQSDAAAAYRLRRADKLQVLTHFAKAGVKLGLYSIDSPLQPTEQLVDYMLRRDRQCNYVTYIARILTDARLRRLIEKDNWLDV